MQEIIVRFPSGKNEFFFACYTFIVTNHRLTAMYMQLVPGPKSLRCKNVYGIQTKFILIIISHHIALLYEPLHEKINNLSFRPVRHKPACTETIDS